MDRLILVLNSGSSTLKASLLADGEQEPAAAATTEWRGTSDETFASLLNQLGASDADVSAVAHRVVHGGAAFTESTFVDDEVTAQLEALVELAPLHNRAAVDVIRAARSRLPNVPHIACFDTAFHATLPEVAWRYPVPFDWAEKWGVRRFGFHGLSVEWAVREASVRLARPGEELALVVAHLGSGCSVTAVRGGRSEWTSMGFTPLEGLMMGTRSGSIDPGLVLHLSSADRLGQSAVETALERESGMLGVSGLASDMRELRGAASGGDARALLAIEMFVARAAEGIAAALTWVDPAAIVFTGGIGENDEATRDEITARLPAGARDIPVLTVRAREDLILAGAAAAFLAESQSGDPRRLAM